MIYTELHLVDGNNFQLIEAYYNETFNKYVHFYCKYNNTKIVLDVSKAYAPVLSTCTPIQDCDFKFIQQQQLRKHIVFSNFFNIFTFHRKHNIDRYVFINFFSRRIITVKSTSVSVKLILYIQLNKQYTTACSIAIIYPLEAYYDISEFVCRIRQHPVYIPHIFRHIMLIYVLSKSIKNYLCDVYAK